MPLRRLERFQPFSLKCIKTRLHPNDVLIFAVLHESRLPTTSHQPPSGASLQTVVFAMEADETSNGGLQKWREMYENPEWRVPALWTIGGTAATAGALKARIRLQESLDLSTHMKNLPSYVHWGRTAAGFAQGSRVIQPCLHLTPRKLVNFREYDIYSANLSALRCLPQDSSSASGLLCLWVALSPTHLSKINFISTMNLATRRILLELEQ